MPVTKDNPNEQSFFCKFYLINHQTVQSKLSVILSAVKTAVLLSTSS